MNDSIKMSKKQSRMKKIIETFQKYVVTYSDQKYVFNYSDETFIDDMLFGIGIAIDNKLYNFASGYKRWKNFLFNYIKLVQTNICNTDLLNQYFEIEKEIYNRFECKEDHDLKIDDMRKYFWKINDGFVCFADTELELNEESANYYENEIYQNTIYQKEDYTMICTMYSCVKYLQIFDNSKRINQ